MNTLKKISIIGKIAKWRFNWDKYDLNYKPKNIESSKFVSAREVAARIPDNATCASSGMGSNGRCSVFFWAIRESFLANQSPKNLTWVTVSAQGSRGKAPGTIEELDPKGLLSTYISGHLETAKSLLKQASKGNIELHTIPQGELSFLLEAQGNGQKTITSKTGINTFLDPRTGNGSQVTPNAKNQYISVAKDDPKKLQYEIPAVEYAMLSAPYADKDGNIYFKNASAITENYEVTRAAKNNGGKVFVIVSEIIEKDENAISLPASMIDGIVVHPLSEQTACISQKNYWNMFTQGAKSDEKESLTKIKFINKLLGIYPTRGTVEDALCRTASLVFTWVASKNNLVNLGTGMPEEVGRLIYEGGLYKDLTFSCESGVYGGIPAPGVYFGAAVNPKAINSSAWMFNHYKDNLDVTVLGFLQVDSNGNVNVSKRGKDVEDYVGPGGFSSICESSKTIIFVGTWMAKAKMEIKDGELNIAKSGIPKFVKEVDEVTFNGQEAVKQGKTVLYVTNVGIFKLTERGLVLTHVAPGVDIETDIMDNCKANFDLPSNGVEFIDESIMSGNGFKLGWTELN